MDTPKIDLLLQYAIIVASEEDDRFSRELGAIHLLKYVYLADLAYAESKGETYTKSPWMFYNFGPWCVDVYKRIEPALAVIGAEKKIYSSKFEEDATRWGLPHTARIEDFENKIDFVARQAIKKFVHKFGSDTESLLGHVYLTKPILTAAPNEQLIFEKNEKRVVTTNIPETKQLSKKKIKIMQQTVQQKIIEKKKALSNKKPIDPPPRYDDVFHAGQEWVNSLGSMPVEHKNGQVVFNPEIWKSKSRYDPDVSE